jgi:hypothetical protein
MVAVAGGLLWSSHRARRARVAEATSRLAGVLGAHVGRSKYSEATAFFDHQDTVCGVWLGSGPDGDLTGVVLRFEEGETPEVGRVALERKDRTSVADYADRKEGPGTGDGDFDASFRVRARDQDKGFVRRIFDAEGRQVARELRRLQGEDTGRPVVVFHGEEGVLEVWRSGHVDDEVRLRELIDLAAQLAGRFVTKKPDPGIPQKQALEV